MTRCLAVVLVAVLGAVAAPGEPWDPPNLVPNPGFEEVDADGRPVGWSQYTSTTDVLHTGARALCYENAEPERYVLSSQTIPLQPGKAYEFSVWVKTEDVVGDENGATICLEWYDADGKYLGGSYPAGPKGTTDWTQVKAVSGRVHERAAQCNVTCYLRPRMTGKAWWDDVDVRQWRQPPLSTMLLEPRYRGEVRPGAKPLEVLAELTLDDWGLRPQDVLLHTELRRASDLEPVRFATHRCRDTRPVLTVPTRGLEPGAYQLAVTLERRNDDVELDGHTWRIRVLDPRAPTDRTVTIDEHNRLIVDGKPFLPLGMYWGSITEEDLKLYADSPMNCLMPYAAPTQEQMDLAQQYRLKVIYTVKDIYHGSAWCPEDVKTVEDERTYMEARAAAYRDHPALLAWYLNDELPLEYVDALEAHQAWMEELDPNHPTWVVLYQVDQVRQYARTFDAIGTDPYPIPGTGAAMAGAWARKTVAAVQDRRPVWMVPQVFNWACYRQSDEEKQGLRPPTLDEMRSMTWQCLVQGARGLVYYSWFDLKRDTVVPFETQWGHVKQVAAQVEALAPVLLSVEPAPSFETPAYEWLHFTTRRVGKTVYLLAVNDQDRAHRARFDLGSRPASVALHGQLGAEAPPEGSTLSVQFGPHEVKVYELRF